MSKDERDLRTAELNELIDELDKSVHCYTPRNPDFAFAVPLPKILKLLAAEIELLRGQVRELQAKPAHGKHRTKRRSSATGHLEKKFPGGAASID